MSVKKTLVLGASNNTERYSNKAVRRLRQFGHPVTAVGLKQGKIADVEILQTIPRMDNLNTITLYLNKNNQLQYEDQILSLKPQRIIFNPGAENGLLASSAAAAGIHVLEACTLVLLNTGQY